MLIPLWENDKFNALYGWLQMFVKKIKGPLEETHMDLWLPESGRERGALDPQTFSLVCFSCFK